MKKSKKALLAALACSAVFAGAFGLAACTPSDGGDSTHNHNWGNWTVETTPQNDTPGKATRTCSGKGKCDAAATAKEATLPVLGSSDYTITNNTATCQDVGTGTYTYNKDGVNVSFTAATPVNPTNHTANCGHGSSATHSHVWGEWVVNESAKMGYIGEATRQCTGAGECDADESLTKVTIPSVLWGDEYTYAEPVVKTEATCQTQSVKTYTYTDTAKGISISFDVTTGSYGDHKIVGNECEVCHTPVVTAVLDNEVTVNANSETATLLVFTAAKAGTYRFIYTQGEDANIDNDTTDFPASVELAAGEKVTYEIKAPEADGTATYKFKVFAVTVLRPAYDDDFNLVASTATVNVGGSETATLYVYGNPMMAGGNAVISYYGNNNLTFTYTEYVLGEYIEQSFTLGGEEMSKTLEFGMYSNSITFTISSDAEEAADEEISYLFEDSEGDSNIELGGEEIEFSDVDYFDGKEFAVEIGDDGDYVISLRGEDADAGYITVEVRDESDELVDANDDGNYTLAAGTYKISVFSNKPNPDVPGEHLPVEGFLSVSKYVAYPVIEVGVAVDVDNDGMENSVYKIEIAEGGDYTFSFTGFEATDVILGVGTGFSGDFVSGDIYAENGVYALEAGTYYITVMSDKYSVPGAWLPDPVSGTMTVSKA